MGFTVGSNSVSDLYVGSKAAKMYVGSKRVWPVWLVFDDFTGTALSSAWTGSGVILTEGMLKKDSTNGASDIWSVESFESDDVTVGITVGDVTSSTQAAAFLFGSPTNYVYFEFKKASWILGTYNGSVWSTLKSGTTTINSNSPIQMVRSGTSVTVYLNGAQIATATTSIPSGPANRQMALTVRRGSSTSYGPTIDTAWGVELDMV